MQVSEVEAVFALAGFREVGSIEFVVAGEVVIDGLCECQSVDWGRSRLGLRVVVICLPALEYLPHTGENVLVVVFEPVLDEPVVREVYEERAQLVERFVVLALELQRHRLKCEGGGTVGVPVEGPEGVVQINLC